MNKFRDTSLNRHNSPKHRNIINKSLQHNVQKDMTGHDIRTYLNKPRDKSEGPLFRNLDTLQLPQMRFQIALLIVILLLLPLSLSLSLSLTHTHTHTHIIIYIYMSLLSSTLFRTSYSSSLISNLKSLTLLIIMVVQRQMPFKTNSYTFLLKP